MDGASAAAILFSMFVSFTLTPALCSKWLRSTDAQHRTSKSRGFYAALDRVYGHMLHWSLMHRAVMLLVAAAVTLSAVLLYPRVGQELVPDDDQSEFAVSVNLPRGTAFAVTEQYTREIEPMLLKLQYVTGVFSNCFENFSIASTPQAFATVVSQCPRRWRPRRWSGSGPPRR